MSKHPTPANPYVTDQRLFDPAVQPNKVKAYKMQLTNFAIFGVLGFMMQTALACSPPPPKIGADGKVVIAPYKYNYVAVVVGHRDVTVPFGRDRVPTPMQALVLEVTQSSSTEVVVGSRQLVVYPGIGADCSPEPRAYNLDSYPLGSKVTVRADRLEAGFVEKV